jgi:hypothetical protein
LDESKSIYLAGVEFEQIGFKPHRPVAARHVDGN